MAWPDIAKGACILLVVLHHTTNLFAFSLTPPQLAPLATTWLEVNDALKPIRMPLFFLISGFFASRALARPWRASHARIAHGYWLYAVWLIILAGVFALDATMPSNRTTSPADFAGELLWAATSLWYLYALVIYFVAAKALQGLPAPVVLSGALLVTAAGSWLPIDEANRLAVLVHFTYFAAGAYYPHLVSHAGHRTWRAWPLAVAFLLLTAGSYAVAAPGSLQLLTLSTVGIPLGITLSVRAAQLSWIGRPLAWLGRRTLRVYVLHMAALSGVGSLWVALGAGVFTTSVAVSSLFPLAATVVVVVVCLAAHEVLVRAGLRWLFEPPRILSRRPVMRGRPESGLTASQSA